MPRAPARSDLGADPGSPRGATCRTCSPRAATRARATPFDERIYDESGFAAAHRKHGGATYCTTSARVRAFCARAAARREPRRRRAAVALQPLPERSGVPRLGRSELRGRVAATSTREACRAAARRATAMGAIDERPQPRLRGSSSAQAGLTHDDQPLLLHGGATAAPSTSASPTAPRLGGCRLQHAGSAGQTADRGWSPPCAQRARTVSRGEYRPAPAGAEGLTST